MPWSEIQGQEHAVRLLRSAFERGQPHHAYLLAGPEGVGKELLARLVAQAANCENDEVRQRPCGTCDHCKGIARGNFPDVMRVMPQHELIARGLIAKSDLEGAPSREIRVDDVRALARRLSFAPLRGRRKIAIVVPAEALNERAQNTLLKTLEEPPPSTTFLLVSSQPDLLLPTIRSRCARVQLQPLPESMLIDRLIAEGVPLAEAQGRAARAQGSLSRALTVGAGRKELLEAVERALDAPDERDLLALAEEHGERDLAAELADAVRAWTRDLLVAQAGAPAEQLESRDLLPLAVAVSARVPAISLFAQAKLCQQVLEALEQNGNARLQLERLLLGARELRHV